MRILGIRRDVAVAWLSLTYSIFRYRHFVYYETGDLYLYTLAVSPILGVSQQHTHKKTTI